MGSSRDAEASPKCTIYMAPSGKFSNRSELWESGKLSLSRLHFEASLLDFSQNLTDLARCTEQSGAKHVPNVPNVPNRNFVPGQSGLYFQEQNQDKA